MSWTPLATQFCLELAFGVLLAMAFVPKAPVGTLFYRVMGTSALVPMLAALVAPIATGALEWTEPAMLATGVAALAYPIYSGPLRGFSWGLGLALGLLGTGSAIALHLAAGGLTPGLDLAVATASALATGAVAGSVGLAMVLGHWYLTVPNLQVRHLVRLNRVTIGAMLVSLLMVGLMLWVFREPLGAGERPLLGATGLFYLGTRVAVGLAMPMLFALMTASSLRYQNTRSATGILYASTVLVLIGTAVSVALQDSYGLPL